MKVKKTIALVLAAAMAISLTACSVNSSSNTLSSQDSGASASQVSEESPVELSILLQGTSASVTKNNPVIEEIEKNTNTKLSVVIAEDIVQSLNLAVASGEVQDIVVTKKFSFYDYIGTGNFLELTDLLNSYGSELTSGHISQEAWDISKVDGGKIYGIPGENYNSKYVTAVREDWLNNLGIEIKENYTLDELENILKAFTNDDPDKNGKNDTYGLSCEGQGSDWEVSLMAIFGAFGGLPNQYYLNNDNFVPFNVSDDFRAALEYINGLWNDGVIDPEMFILTADQAVQKLAQGKSGVFSSWWSGPKDVFKAGIEGITPDADFARVFITSNDGSKVGMMDNGLLNYMTMISASCKDPVAAMKFMNYLISDEGYFLSIYGIEGLTFKVEDGYLSKITTDQDYTPLATVVRRLDSNPITDQYKKQELVFETKMDETSYTFEQIQKMEGAPLYQSIFYGVPTTTDDQELGADLDTYVTQSVVSFITGEKAINDANWQAYKEAWVQKGGQKILDSYAAKYNELKGASYKSAKIS